MKTANPRIPTINGRSPSMKFALFEGVDSLPRIMEGGIERIGLPEANFRAARGGEYKVAAESA